MTRKLKLNDELVTQEEWNLPFGLCYTAAAERLGLKYLYEPALVLRLLVDQANEAYRFSMTAKLTSIPFWRAMNRKADKLAAIFKAENPAYMAPPRFTDPGQLRAELYKKLNEARPDDPPNAAWRKDPIRAHARDFMAFFLELTEGGIKGQGTIPNEQLSLDHIKKYAGDFLGMDAAMLSLELKPKSNTEAPPCG